MSSTCAALRHAEKAAPQALQPPRISVHTAFNDKAAPKTAAQKAQGFQGG
jgi:hypothetical protein